MTSEGETNSGFRNVVGKFTSKTVQESQSQKAEKVLNQSTQLLHTAW
jgi:hypothetical protein